MSTNPPEFNYQNNPPQTPETPKEGSVKGFFQSPFLKFLLIGFLILILLIPMNMVEGVIRERESYQQGVKQEIASAWGGSQVLVGPILTVPYKENKKTHFLHVMPEELKVTGKLDPELRARGIFKSVVYTGKLDVSGKIPLTEIATTIDPKVLDWQHATVTYRASDMQGIQALKSIKFANKAIAEKMVSSPAGDNTVVQIPINIASRGANMPFSFELDIHGSETLQFVPVGRKTNIHIDSGWSHPSFIGTYLPTTRDVKDDSFSADWSINGFARHPGSWTNDSPTPQVSFTSASSTDTTTTATTAEYRNYETATAAPAQNVLGVSLLQPVNNYTESLRSAKYSILFLALTFLTFFLCEVMLRTRIHAIQYLLVGLALCLFYLLLVSMSEFLAFGSAYLIASGATIALITGYTGAIVQTRKLALTGAMAGLLSLLYAYLYVLLQLEDLSLLFGSIGLFVILGAVMYITRNIDWYSGKGVAAT